MIDYSFPLRKVGVNSSEYRVLISILKIRKRCLLGAQYLALGVIFSGAIWQTEVNAENLHRTISAMPKRAEANEVAVDVGHTLAAPGAISARGVDEFYFNQTLSKQLKIALEARRLRVRPINFAGDIAHLEDRPKEALGADFFIAMHHDSVQEKHLKTWEWDGAERNYSDDFSGFSLFVSRNNPQPETSLRCASAIGALLQRAGFVPATHHADSMVGVARPYADEANAVHYYDNLIVLYKTSLPAVLFEAGIIKNRDEELLLQNQERQARMADAIATGIAACLTVAD